MSVPDPQQSQKIQHSSIQDSQIQQGQAHNLIQVQGDYAPYTRVFNLFCGESTTTSDGLRLDLARKLLLNRIQPDIDERLKVTLYRDTWLNPDLEEQPRQVGIPAPNRVVQLSGKSPETINLQTTILEVFEDVNRKLLILGEPGLGKTTTLLKLAGHLVQQALDNPGTAIPVIFELSEWKDDQQSIRSWLVERLEDRYGLKKKVTQRWLEEELLVPLLDGLDELGLEHQRKCVQEVNEFAQQYPHLVVCCRAEEYAAGEVRLNELRGAVSLQPLKREQVQRYLQQLGQQQQLLWKAIETQPEMQAMVQPDSEGKPGILQIPLLLRMAAEVYVGKPFGSKIDLLEAYINQRLEHEVKAWERRQSRKRKWAYNSIDKEPKWRQTRHYLKWLSKKLDENRQTEFIIERMQPHELESKALQWQYWLILFVIASMTIGAISLVNFLPYLRHMEETTWVIIPNVFLTLGLLGGFILATESKPDGARLILYFIGLPFCFLFRRRLPRNCQEHVPILHNINFYLRIRRSFPTFKEVKMWIYDSTIFFCSDITSVLSIPHISLMVYLTHELLIPVTNAIKLKQISSKLKESLEQVEHTVTLFKEEIEQSKYSHYYHLFILGKEYDKIFRKNGGRITVIILNSINYFFGLSFFVMSLAFSLPSLLVTEEIRKEVRPNEGVKEALRTSLLISLILTISISTISIYELQLFVYTKLIPFILSCIVCFSYLPLIKHLSLRLVLCFSAKVIPWNYAQFLDYCVERRLLQRVGGRYRFLHRELLEHFAQKCDRPYPSSN